LIPDELIDRQKQGFGVPLREWFVDRLGEKAHEELEACCRRHDLFDLDEGMKLIDRRGGLEAWGLLNFALWSKHWL